MRLVLCVIVAAVATTFVSAASADNYGTTKAEAARSTGDRAGAIAAYRKALSADPGSIDACFKLAYELDMVGEDTEKTGGTFLIEKMPDPSAV